MIRSLRILGMAFPAFVSLALLFVLYRRIDPAALVAGLRAASPGWAGLYVLFAALEPVLRGLRWSVLVDSPSHGAAVRGLYMAKAGNNLLPLRMGDAVRSQYIRDRSGIPYSRSAASILAESALDLSMLGILVTIFGVYAASSRGLTYGLVLAAALPAAAGLVYMLGRRARRKAAHGSGLVALFGKVIYHLGTMLRGRRAVPVLSLTVLLWVFTLLTSWFGLKAFLPSVTPLGVISTIVFVYLSVLIPSAPGFVGTYHAAVAGSLALMGYGISSYPAAPVAIHLLQFLPQTILGLALGLRYLFSNDWRKAYSDFSGVRRSLLGRPQ